MGQKLFKGSPLTRADHNKTPFDAWSGQKPSVSHFKIFGSICYAHIPDEKRTKLDKKSERCIFVGYSPESKAFRLYNIDKKKLIVSRGVMEF